MHIIIECEQCIVRANATCHKYLFSTCSQLWALIRMLSARNGGWKITYLCNAMIVVERRWTWVEKLAGASSTSFKSSMFAFEWLVSCCYYYSAAERFRLGACLKGRFVCLGVRFFFENHRHQISSVLNSLNFQCLSYFQGVNYLRKFIRCANRRRLTYL